jgi:hypothetical protein
MWWHNRPANTAERNIEEIIEDLRDEIYRNGFFYYFCKSYDNIVYVFKVKEVIDRRRDLPNDILPEDWKDCNDYYEDLASYSMKVQEAKIFFKTFEIIPLTMKVTLDDLDLGANKFRPLNLNAVYGFSRKLEEYLTTI